MTAQQNALRQWYELVKESEDHIGVFFDDAVEHYIVLTLDEYMLDKSLLDSPVSLEYLKSITLSSVSANKNLRKVGDRCLLISGLFPERAKKITSVGYYIGIGQQAYFTLSDRVNIQADPHLFQKLGSKFLEIREVLNAMRFVAENRILN